MRPIVFAYLSLALIGPAHAFDPQPTTSRMDGLNIQPNPVLRQGPGPDTSAAMATVQNSNVSAQDIFGPQVPPGWFTVEGVRSVVDVVPGTKSITTSAFGYYVRNRTASKGQGSNAAGLYGAISCEVDGSSCWGINPTLIDARANGAATSGKGRKLIGAEFDLTATSPGTIIQGVALLGSSRVQPAGAYGFSCGNLGVAGVHWDLCFNVADGLSRVGAYLGVSYPGTAAGSASAPIQFAYKDPANTVSILNLYARDGSLLVQPNSPANGIAIGTSAKGIAPAVGPAGPDANIGLDLLAKGAGVIVARSHFVAPAGVAASSYTSGAAVGVSCKGPPTANFEVTKGIVTHC